MPLQINKKIKIKKLTSYNEMSYSKFYSQPFPLRQITFSSNASPFCKTGLEMSAEIKQKVLKDLLRFWIELASRQCVPGCEWEGSSLGWVGEDSPWVASAARPTSAHRAFPVSHPHSPLPAQYPKPQPSSLWPEMGHWASISPNPRFRSAETMCPPHIQRVSLQPRSLK